MRILVLGAGVVGTTTAYYLQQAGHEVTVLDRQPAAGMETSFANAGQVSPGYSAPWAGPGVPLKAVKWMMMTHRPLVIRPLLDPFMWRWMALMLRNCTEAAYHVNKARMVRLAEYSRDCLLALRADTGAALRRPPARHAATVPHAEAGGPRRRGHGRAGRGRRAVRGAGPRRLPGRRAGPGARDGQFLGGLRLPGDETGDAHQFTQRLAALAADGAWRSATARRRAAGARGRPGDGRRGRRRAPPPADHYVVAFGSYSRKLLAPLGIDIPVYPVKGYSITIPIEIRGGRAGLHRDGRDLQGGDHPAGRPHPRRRHGGAGRVQRHPVRAAAGHAGLLGQQPVPAGGRRQEGQLLDRAAPDDAGRHADHRADAVGNLWLNTGHGTLGWTMSCGSARVLADLLSGRTPDIEYADLAMSRYG